MNSIPLCLEIGNLILEFDDPAAVERLSFILQIPFQIFDLLQELYINLPQFFILFYILNTTL